MAFYCANPRDFWLDFKDNMDALGLGPVPKSLFETEQAIVGALSTATAVIKLLPTATVAEAFGAAFSWEIPAVIAAMAASAYGGGIVGSLIVAESKDLTCGVDLFDAIQFIKRIGVDTFWADHLAKHPVVYKTSLPGRLKYGSSVSIYRN
jgi:hypothetical protein